MSTDRALLRHTLATLAYRGAQRLRAAVGERGQGVAEEGAVGAHPAILPARSLIKTVNLRRQRGIALADAARVVRRQPDLHLVVHVAPLRMVVHPLRAQRHGGHEAEGLDEVAEAQLALDAVVAELPVIIHP